MYSLKIKFYLGGSFFMKKSVSLKLIVFSFLLVSASITYSATPTIGAGTGADSTKAGIDNEASKEKSSAFGYKNIADGEESSAFGFGNKASGKRSSAFGHSNKVSGERSSAFGYNNEATNLESTVIGNNYKVTGSHSGAIGVGTYDEVNRVYKRINGGGNSYMIGNDNNIADGASDNFILGNAVDIAPVKDGRVWWNAPEQVWKEIGTIGEECGLDWCAGGYGQVWGKGWDSPHFELMQGR